MPNDGNRDTASRKYTSCLPIHIIQGTTHEHINVILFYCYCYCKIIIIYNILFC